MLGRGIPAQLEHLPDDHIAHGFELLLPGQRHPLGRMFRVGAAHLLPHLVPQVIGGGNPLILCQLVHDGVHHRLGLRRQIAVHLFAGGVLEPVGQFHDQPLQHLVFTVTVFQIRGQLRHGLLRIPAQGIPVLRLLLVDVEQILLKNAPAER